MIRFKALKTQEYETQFESLLKKSSSINEFNSTLKHFYKMPALENALKKLINSKSEKQLSMLVELREQIDDFNEQNQISLEQLSNALEKKFDNYNKQQEKFQTELVNLFLQHFSKYFRETHPLSRELLDDLKALIPLQTAELGIKGNAKDQLDFCIQILETHVPHTIDFKNALEIIKNFYTVHPEISQFIFIAHDEAFLRLEKIIKNHLADLNMELIKNDYDNHQGLFSEFYRESIITLVNYYQDYKNITEDFKHKFDILKDVGEPIKDWIDDYQDLSSSDTFFSESTPQGLKSARDELSKFKQQLNWEDSTKFLQEIKKKAQTFLNNQIESLEQQFQDYRARVAEFSSYSPGASDISNKLLQMLESCYSEANKIWIKRQKRMASIKTIEELKSFKHHFPKANPFDADVFNFNELYAALLLLEEPNPANQHEMFIQNFLTIPIEKLTEKIFFILENLNNTLLPSAINQLLQFIHSESTHPVINETRNHLSNYLKKFFIDQPEKTAFCLVEIVDPISSLLNNEAYGNLINYLHHIDSTELKKIKEKINASHKNKFKNDEEIDTFQKLISTKETLNLFEENPTPKTIWDACVFFQKFYSSSRGFKQPLPFLNKTTNLPFIAATENLNSLLQIFTMNKEPTYSSNLFVKPNKQKQALIENLITDLKNTPITQLDKNYVRDFFEKWRNENEPIVNEPRYRLLIGVFMLIYRHIKKLFSDSSFETTSSKTVNNLQTYFCSACENLEQIKIDLDPFNAKLNQNLSADSEKSLALCL